jgi:hypothetical protein
MEIIEEENLVIFTVDDLLVHWKQERNQHLHEIDKVTLDEEYGLKRLDGSWTKFVITNKKKLMLFCIKYGIN